MTRNPPAALRQPLLPLGLPGPRRNTRRATRQGTATAVLVTGCFGSLHLYTRRGAGPLRDVRIVTHAAELTDLIRRLSPPCVVVLCGTRHISAVARCVLPRHDLYVVPTCWLRAAGPRDPHGRATLAAQLVTAHRRAPIERFVGPDDPWSLF